MKSVGRRLGDRYFTPGWATERLLENVEISGLIVEPCVGQGHIANVLRRMGVGSLFTNDIDPGVDADFHADAMDNLWNKDLAGVEVDWIVSNPPFAKDPPPGKLRGEPLIGPLVQSWLPRVRRGVAVLARLSFWEPTIEDGRGVFLEENPPTTFISLPRISFTGDGHTDNVSTAWFVWDKRWMGTRAAHTGRPQQSMRVVSKRAGRAAVALPGMR